MFLASTHKHLTPLSPSPVIVIIIVAVVVVATKKQKLNTPFGGPPGGSNNPLYVPPQDVLSLVPESEATAYKVKKKEKEM